MSERDEEVQFSVSSLFGMMTGKGLVAVQFGSQKCQIEPGEARRLAMLLLESAEAAESDAAFVHALTAMGMARDGVAKMLQALRTERERQQRGEG
jgi:hypothetical protein